MSGVRDTVVSNLVPSGVLRAAINLGNPVLAQGTAAAPAGVTVDIARELAVRLGVPVDLICGFIRDALQRSGQDSALAAPPEPLQPAPP